jgi:hypothetical protein
MWIRLIQVNDQMVLYNCIVITVGFVFSWNMFRGMVDENMIFSSRL